MPQNPISDFLNFVIGQYGDQVSLSKAGLGGLVWLTLAVYWVLFVGGIGIAIYSWARDASQRTAAHLSIFIMRFTMAGMWALATLWKLPWPVSDGFKYWLGASVKGSSFHWHASMMAMFNDHIALVQPLVFLLETALTISLMLGIGVRLAGVIGTAFLINLWIGLYNAEGEWPWTYIGIAWAHGMFAAAAAGRSLGLDHWLRDRVPGPVGRLYRVIS